MQILIPPVFIKFKKQLKKQPKIFTEPNPKHGNGINGFTEGNPKHGNGINGFIEGNPEHGNGINGFIEGNPEHGNSINGFIEGNPEQGNMSMYFFLYRSDAFLLRIVSEGTLRNS